MLKEREFDIVVSDYQMPKCNGLELLKKIRSSGSEIPFIIFTAHSREEVAIEALNLGADQYVKKGGDPKSQFIQLIHMVKTTVRHRRAERALIRNEMMFREIVEKSYDGIVMLDVNGTIIEWNKGMTKITEISSQEAIGANIWEIRDSLITNLSESISRFTSYRDWTRYMFKEFTEKDISRMQNVTILHRDGVEKHFNHAPIIVESDEGVHLGLVIRDITSEVKSKERAQKEYEIYQLISEASATSPNLQSLCEHISIGLAEIIGIDNCAVYMLDNEDKELRLISFAGSIKQASRLEERIGIFNESSITAYIARKKERIASPSIDDSVDQMHRSRMGALDVSSHYGWPLLGSQNTLLGVLHIGSQSSFKIPDEELRFYDSIMGTISTAIERQLVKDEVKKSEDQFRSFVEELPLGVIIFQDGKTVYINPVLKNILSINESTEHLLGMDSVFDKIHPLDRERFTSTLSRFRDERRVRNPVTFRILGGSNEVIWVESMAKEFEYDNKPAIQILISEITDEMRAKEALERERIAFRIIAESAIHATSTKDLCRRILAGLLRTIGFDFGTIRLVDSEINAMRVVSALGVPDGVLQEDKQLSAEDEYHFAARTARTLKPVFAPNIETHEISQTHQKRVRDLGIKSLISWPIIGSNNELLGIIQLAAYDQKELRGTDRMFFEILADLFSTALQRKKTEDALIESEERFRTLVDQSLDGIIIINEEGSIREWNTGMERLTGYSREEIIGRLFWDVQAEFSLGESDKELLARESKAIFTSILETGEIHKDHRQSLRDIRHRNNEVRRVQSHIFFIESGRMNLLGVVMSDVTTLVDAQKALEKSQDLLRASVDSSPNAVIAIAQDDKIIFANSRFKELFRLPDTIRESDSFKMYRSYILPQVVKGRRYFDRNSELDSEIKDTIDLMDGRKIEVNSTPLLFDEKHIGRVWSFIDITEKRSVEERMRMLSAALEASADGVVITNSEGVIIYANDVAERLAENFGLWLYGREMDSILTTSDGMTMSFNDVFHIGSSQDMMHLVDKEGREFWGQVASSIIKDDKDNTIGVVSVIRDITSDKETERILERQREELSDFARIMAHDLRSSLHNILGYANLLEDEDNKQHVDGIVKMVSRIDTILARSLKLADAGLVIGKKEEVDLDSTVRYIARLVVPDSIEYFQDELPKIKCDPEKIQQVIENLLKNAVEHGKPSEVEVRYVENEDSISLLFLNDGEKIKQEYSELLFERRFSRKSHGGMGLAIVKKIVKAHGWDVRYDASHPKTCFEISIPKT